MTSAQRFETDTYALITKKEMNDSGVYRLNNEHVLTMRK